MALVRHSKMRLLLSGFAAAVVSFAAAGYTEGQFDVAGKTSRELVAEIRKIMGTTFDDPLVR